MADKNLEARMGNERTVELNGEPIFVSQYEALKEFCSQFGCPEIKLCPESMYEDETVRTIWIEKGVVTGLNSGGDWHYRNTQRYEIATKDHSLKIPKELVFLDTLIVNCNGLRSIELPDTLTSLKYLDVSMNPIKILEVPKEYASLEEVVCSYTDVEIIRVPASITKLAKLQCSNNEQLYIIGLYGDSPNLRELDCSNSPNAGLFIDGLSVNAKINTVLDKTIIRKLVSFVMNAISIHGGIDD